MGRLVRYFVSFVSSDGGFSLTFGSAYLLYVRPGIYSGCIPFYLSPQQNSSPEPPRRPKCIM